MLGVRKVVVCVLVLVHAAADVGADDTHPKVAAMVAVHTGICLRGELVGMAADGTAVQIPLRETCGMHGMVTEGSHEGGNSLIHGFQTDRACREVSITRREHSRRRKGRGMRMCRRVKLDGGDLADATSLRDEAAQKGLSL